MSENGNTLIEQRVALRTPIYLSLYAAFFLNVGVLVGVIFGIVFGLDLLDSIAGGDSDIEREADAVLSLMATAYVFGALGSLARLGLEAQRDAEIFNTRVSLFNSQLLFGPFIGGVFGMVSALAIDSGVVAKLIYETPPVDTTLEPTFSGIAVVGFLIGLFASESFQKLKHRIDTSLDTPGSKVEKKNAH